MSREHEHYALATQHVARAEARIAQQREVLRGLQAANNEAAEAQRLLEEMLRALDQMRAHLRMIEAELTRDDGTLRPRQLFP
jgi:hypothetical protein